jgi:hypothetical protein
LRISTFFFFLQSKKYSIIFFEFLKKIFIFQHQKLFKCFLRISTSIYKKIIQLLRTKLPRHFGDTKWPPLRNISSANLSGGGDEIVSGIWNPATQAKTWGPSALHSRLPLFLRSFRNIFQKQEISAFAPKLLEGFEKHEFFSNLPEKFPNGTNITNNIPPDTILFCRRNFRMVATISPPPHILPEKFPNGWIVWYPRTQETRGQTLSPLP